jgi:hypothetical protein
MSRQIWVETLITSEIDGPTLTAAAAATMLPAAAKFTFPPNFFDIGRSIRITASGRVSTVITTPGTLRFDVRLGAGVVVFDSLAILPDATAAYVTVGWYLDILMTCRAIGTTGNFFGQGKFCCTDIAGQVATPPKGAHTAILPWNSPPAVGGNVDTTISNQLDMFFTQTVATGSLTCHQFALESMN